MFEKLPFSQTQTFFPLEELDEEEDEEDEVEATLLREPAIILESNHI